MGANVLLMAAGTGGHVFPGLACAQEFAERGYQVHWLGAGRGIECRVVPAAGFKLHNVSATGVRGKGGLRLLLAPWQLLVALWQSYLLLRRLKPVCVVGFGGYVTGPGGLAARLCGIPLIIHEQNAVAGTANRKLAGWAARVCQAFPDTFADSTKVVTTGNPLRTGLLSAVAPKEAVARPPRLLVLGGSLGAEALNRLLPEALALLPPELRPQVWHQTGEAHEQITVQRYRESAVEAQVSAFIDDVAAAYVWADLVVCRAGALTVSELALMGRAAFLVPLPQAIDDHQRKNAQFLTSHGAAVVLEQHSTTAGELADRLAEVFQHDGRLLEMSRQAARLARPEATRQVVDICLEVVNG